MNTERLRHGGVLLCFAAICGVLYLLTQESGWSEPFAIAGIVAVLAGLAYMATGLSGAKDEADTSPRGGRG